MKPLKDRLAEHARRNRLPGAVNVAQVIEERKQRAVAAKAALKTALAKAKEQNGGAA